jgi:hypothetical protein
MGFQYGYADKAGNFKDSYGFVDDKSGAAQVETGDLVIPMNQRVRPSSKS